MRNMSFAKTAEMRYLYTVTGRPPQVIPHNYAPIIHYSIIKPRVRIGFGTKSLKKIYQLLHIAESYVKI